MKNLKTTIVLFTLLLTTTLSAQDKMANNIDNSNTMECRTLGAENWT